jgi:hypothetical protein
MPLHRMKAGAWPCSGASAWRASPWRRSLPWTAPPHLCKAKNTVHRPLGAEVRYLAEGEL